MVRARHAVTSAGKLLGMNTITGEDGTPYMTRVWVGRLRLHIFHRPDHDPDCHDHPWDFWTFPIWPPHGYVEEVVDGDLAFLARESTVVAGSEFRVMQRDTRQKAHRRQIVPALSVSYRAATHCHRVLGAWTGEGQHPYWGDKHRLSPSAIERHGWDPVVEPDRKIITLIWRGKAERKWGFLKNRDGRWCWVAWREYVFGGGKDGPCQ